MDEVAVRIIVQEDDANVAAGEQIVASETPPAGAPSQGEQQADVAGTGGLPETPRPALPEPTPTPIISPPAMQPAGYEPGDQLPSPLPVDVRSSVPIEVIFPAGFTGFGGAPPLEPPEPPTTPPAGPPPEEKPDVSEPPPRPLPAGAEEEQPREPAPVRVEIPEPVAIPTMAEPATLPEPATPAQLPGPAAPPPPRVMVEAAGAEPPAEPATVTVTAEPAPRPTATREEAVADLTRRRTAAEPTDVRPTPKNTADEWTFSDLHTGKFQRKHKDAPSGSREAFLIAEHRAGRLKSAKDVRQAGAEYRHAVDQAADPVKPAVTEAATPTRPTTPAATAEATSVFGFPSRRRIAEEPPAAASAAVPSPIIPPATVGVLTGVGHGRRRAPVELVGPPEPPPVPPTTLPATVDVLTGVGTGRRRATPEAAERRAERQQAAIARREAEEAEAPGQPATAEESAAPKQKRASRKKTPAATAEPARRLDPGVREKIWEKHRAAKRPAAMTREPFAAVVPVESAAIPAEVPIRGEAAGVVTPENVRSLLDEFAKTVGVDLSKVVGEIQIGKYIHPSEAAGLEFRDEPTRSRGTYATATDTEQGKGIIGISSENVESLERLAHVLAHEVGHAIDSYLGGGGEKFASDVPKTPAATMAATHAEVLEERDFATPGRVVDDPAYTYSKEEAFANLIAEAMTGKDAYLEPTTPFQTPQEREAYEREVLGKLPKGQPRVRTAEQRLLRVPGPQEPAQAPSAFDSTLDVVNKLGSMVGGSIGRVVGSVVNLAAAFRKLMPSKPAQYAPTPYQAPKMPGMPALPPLTRTQPPQPQTYGAPAGAATTSTGPARPGKPARKVKGVLEALPVLTAERPGKMPPRGESIEPLPGPLAPEDKTYRTAASRGPSPPGPAAGGQNWRTAAAKGGPGSRGGGGGAIGTLARAAGFGKAVAAALPVVGVVMAAVEVLKALRDATTGAVRAVGDFAAAVVNPSADPAQFVGTIGESVKGVSDKLFWISPIMGIFGGVIGEATSSVGKFMSAMDGMVDRYATFSGPLMAAKVTMDVRQLMGDMRRAQEAAPDLISFLQTRQELQDRFEDAKIKFMAKLMPLALKGMELAEKMLPLVELMVELISSFGSLIPGISDEAKKIRQNMDEEKMKELMSQIDATTIALRGYFGPGFTGGDRPGVQTPLTEGGV